MVSAYFSGDGPCHPVRVGLSGLVVGLGVGFGVLATPCYSAWADPADDSTASTQSPSDDDGTVDPDDQQTGADAEGGSTANDPTVDSAPEGDSPSQSEVTLGDGGPEVTIRYSGGYGGDAPAPVPQAPAEESTPAETAPADPTVDTEQTPTVTPEVPSAVEPQPAADVAIEAEQPARVDDPDVLEPLRLEPVDNRFHLGTPDPQPTRRSVVAGTDTAATTSTGALSAPLITGPPFPPFGELFTEPDGFLTAASALLSGVLNVLFEPTPGSAPPDSPIVWAVLGLVRRQFAGGANPNPMAEPGQPSRGPDDDPETFIVVTGGRYAYVVNRGSNSVTVVDVDTHEVVDVPVALDQLVSTPVVSPDGARMFVTRAHNGGVYAIDTVLGSTVDIDDATAHSEPIVAGGYVGPNDYYVPDGGLAFSPDGGLLYISRQHAQIVSGLFLPADGDVVVVGNDPSDPATYLQVIGGPIDVEA